MAQDGPQVELYDFLYKDTGRIASYYAQLFSGRLTSLEESVHDQTNAENKSKANIKIVELEKRTLKQNQTGQKRTIDPHDLITTDVLAYFVENGRLQSSLTAAGHGEMVLVKGTVTFIDQLVMETALLAFEEEAKEYMRLPKNQRNPNQVKIYEITPKILSKFQIPSAFLLNTQESELAGGVIKESGMEESISSHYVKHGLNGLSDVYLVAIKEQSTNSILLPVEQMFGVAQQLAQGLSAIIFPPEAIRVTPLALFRKL